MLKFKPDLKIIVVLLASISLINADTYQTPADIRASEVRGPTRYQYSINLIVALNSSLSMSTLNQSSPIYWAWTRYTNETFYLEQQNPQTKRGISLQIFNVLRPNVRDPAVMAQFQCSPTELQCSTITVPKFNLTYLGMYSYQSQINDFDSLFVDYNISTYINNLQFEGLDTQNFVYNSSTQLISVRANARLEFTCSIMIAQNSIHEPPAELMVFSEANKYDECSSSETKVEQLPLSSVVDYLDISTYDNINIVLYRLSKTCLRTFTKYDLNKNFGCELRAKNQSVPEGLQRLGTYSTLLGKLDVQYEAEKSAQSSYVTNRTLIVGQQIAASFVCPFESNPSPVFEWRVVSGESNETLVESLSKRRILKPSEFVSMEREYQIPKDLEVGLYVLECRARVGGIVNKVSETVQFHLRVIRAKNSTGAIIGGVVGGIIALILISLLVLFIVKRNRTKTPDELEKAKELDIDINDGNPHLSSRTNLSSSGPAQGNQQPVVNGKQAQSGINHKVIPGMMVPSSTAASYAAIAHAAAAAAQSNQQRNQFNTNASASVNVGQLENGSTNNLFSSNSSNNLLNSSKSYNNPGFFESTSYPIQNPLESPPPYDAAFNPPANAKQQQSGSNQQLLLQQQQKDYMGSNTRLLSGSSTPQTQKHPAASLSYTVTPQQSMLNSTPSGISHSMQQLGFQQQQQQQANLQYTTVQNMARNRNPLNGLDMDQQAQQQQQQQTQYSTMAQLNPIDV